ncbi:hypothetical protein MYU51_001825 [Penicillium brevicompactum]|uniref:uncharacterized protein n=1 Tax=Penicillium brevicompactum TaxID=5074 RepID=UPI0025404C3E|nr:uncharacterized protein N7506_009807 [Penicillium brevicompactum]KAJ5326705.1 hypothetical protein N7506_009807 [Penicillium brevicompactum]
MPSPTRSSHRPASPSAPSSNHRHHRSRTGHSHRHRPRNSSRSRSPHRSDRHKSDRHHQHSGDKDHERSERSERRHRDVPKQPVVLPYQARELSRRHLEAYEPMFAMYLDIQKGKFIEDLSEDEVKGRWKSFTQKWNKGELAEGWYDPATLERARANFEPQPAESKGGRESPDYTQGERASGAAQESQPGGADDDDDDEDDEYGPTLPQPGSARVGFMGPTIPRMQDLELKRETAIEDAIASRGESRDQYRAELRSHKAATRHLEDEIAPRAEAGTRERQLEKRREVASSNRAFADSRRGDSPDGARDEDLMGGDNEFSALKKEKEKDQRKKNEREIRREEILRARTAEREERVQQYRQKEEETMGFLQALAKQRFG